MITTVMSNDSNEYFYLNQANNGCIVGHVDLQTDSQIPGACWNKAVKMQPSRAKNIPCVTASLFFFKKNLPVFNYAAWLREQC